MSHAPSKPKDKRPPKRKRRWFHKFCAGFFIWLLGIVISAIPIFLKHLNIFFNNKSINEYNFFREILGDFDFSFISVSVLFILCLEELLLRDSVPGWHKVFRLCTAICLVVTCSIYCVAFFVRGQLPHKLPITQFGYNMVTLCLTIILGAECHIGLSLREGESAC